VLQQLTACFGVQALRKTRELCGSFDNAGLTCPHVIPETGAPRQGPAVSDDFHPRHDLPGYYRKFYLCGPRRFEVVVPQRGGHFNKSGQGQLHKDGRFRF